MRFVLPEWTLGALNLVLVSISREMTKLQRQGEDTWLQPKRFCLPGTMPTSPEAGAVSFDVESKKLLYWHEGQSRLYESAAFTPVDE